GMRLDKGFLPILRAWIVGSAQGDLCQGMTNFAQEVAALAPAGVLDDDARGVAVKAGGIGGHAGDVHGLVAQVALAPGSGHDNYGTDVAELAGDALVQLGSLLGLALRSLFAGSKDDRVEGLIRAGNVDLFDALMAAQVRSLGGTSVDDAQGAGIDEGAETFLEQRTEIGVDGVGFVENDLVLHKKFVDDVQRTNTGDVAGAQDQRDLARVMFVFVNGSLRGDGLFLCHARLHPDLRRDAHKEEFVRPRMGKDLGDDL